MSVIGDSGASATVTILRDTGAAQSMMLDSVLPMLSKQQSASHVLVKSFGCDSYSSIPVYTVTLESDLVNEEVNVGVVSELPVKGVDLLLGNDLAGSRVVAVPQLCVDPMVNISDDLETKFPGTFPSCVVTRSMSHKANNDEYDLRDTFFAKGMMSSDIHKFHTSEKVKQNTSLAKAADND